MLFYLFGSGENTHIEEEESGEKLTECQICYSWDVFFFSIIQ